MTSTAISKVSAIVLLIGGIAFLFASGATLPLLAPDIPPSAFTAMVSIRIAIESSGNDVPWLIAVPTILFSAIYAWLLLRGPLERDMRSTP